MEIKVSKNDVIWGYVAMVFNYGTGLVTLPFILSMLSAEEVGMNYLMLTISNLVILADFGFSQQFGRNITYVLSGVQRLIKEGVSSEVNSTINYHLVAVLIRTAQYVYMRLGLMVLLLMLTAGTVYIYHVTNGFSSVSHSLWIWLLFSVSVFFNFYYKYYTALLTGTALMMEYNKSCMYSKIVYLLICIALLFAGCGLMSVVIANFVAPFVQRYYSYISFYSREMKDKLRGEQVPKQEIKDTFNTLWFNTKRLGSIFVAQYGISQSGIFLCGLFLSLPEIASYGLLMQLVGGVLCTCAKSLFNTVTPLFGKDIVRNDKQALVRHFSLGNFVFWVIFIIGGLLIVLVAPWMLQLMHSNSLLPSTLIMVIFVVDALLDYNHSNFTYIFMAENRYPFLKADIYTGVAVVIFTFATLYFTDWGLLGVVICRFICMLCYNYWKWPIEASRKLQVSIACLVKVGWQESSMKVEAIIKNKK
ncbi:O-unit flippase-like protein [uncultured Bacteroides sp.]|uniref:O-unit flippase-like protein n=1 Tax=uncultured Bacteroides sp. TaxID=162156 RepID=UPI0025E7DEB2|nr:O-unit flippase-like protein [uncultured Bacteroides sp.]